MNSMRYRWGHWRNSESYPSQLKAIPFLFTFANAILGVWAIINALEGNLALAVYCIMGAAVMDACDGRCARVLGMTSPLGAELDSLADSISFCVAPAIVMYAWYPGVFGVWGTCAVVLYVCAGLYRLARFNILIGQQSSEVFMGLPVPMAAFFVSSIVLYSHWIHTHTLWFIVYKAVPLVLMVGVALLMVSHIPFPSGKKYRFRRGRVYAIAHLLCWMILAWILVRGYPLIFFAISAYIISGLVRWGYYYIPACWARYSSGV